MKLIQTSLDMLKAMVAAVRPGATDIDLVNAAVQSISKTSLREFLKTSTLGHGYGVGWEYPDMILWLEPGGVVVPSIGGAAQEDEVIVTEDGCEVMTKCAERAETLLKSEGIQPS